MKRAFIASAAVAGLIVVIAPLGGCASPGTPTAEPAATTTRTQPTTTTTTPPPTTTTTVKPPPPPPPALAAQPAPPARPAPKATRAPAPPPPAPKPAPACDPNYSGCVPVDSDVDCAGGSGNGPSYVRGPVRVVGSDIYGLDADDDGIACE